MAERAVTGRGGRAHRWAGLLLGAPIAAVALSGAGLVWRDAIERPPQPAIGRAGPLSDALFARARAALGPDGRIARATWPASGGSVIVAAGLGDDASAVRVDAASGRVLGGGSGGSGDTLRRLHDRWPAAGGGRTLVVLLGLATVIVVLSGVPPLLAGRSAGRAARLHRVLGAVIAAPLLLLAATGAWLSFAGRAADGASPPPLERPAQPLRGVIARARPYARGEPLRQVDWPTARSPDWTLRFGGADGPVIKVADDSGAARAALAREGTAPAAWARRLHAGTGPVRRVIATLTGLATALLAVTGVMLALRRPGAARVRRRR